MEYKRKTAKKGADQIITFSCTPHQTYKIFKYTVLEKSKDYNPAREMCPRIQELISENSFEGDVFENTAKAFLYIILINKVQY